MAGVMMVMSSGPAAPAAPAATAATAGLGTTVSAKFKTIAAELATADREAQDASSNADQAKAKAKKVAVEVIRAAYKEKAHSGYIRKELLNAKVPKGSVSKIVTVLEALRDGTIVLSDVKSMSGAYTAVKTVAKITAATRAAAHSGTVTATGTAAPVKITGKQGLDAIIAEIQKERDPDKKFALIGEWITTVTTALSALAKAIADGEEE